MRGRGRTREAGEIPKRLPGAELTRLIRRVKQRKLDRGLQSPKLFYTCPRLPAASAKRAVAEAPGNHEIQWTIFMTEIEIQDNYVPAHWGLIGVQTYPGEERDKGRDRS